MEYLITGIIFVVLPIITWFGASHFVEKLGITLFYWVIGIPMILVGADKLTPGGIWTVKKKPSSKPSKGHYVRTYQFDDDGKTVGQPTEHWIKD